MRIPKPSLVWLSLGLLVLACQTSTIGASTQTAQYLEVRQTELAIQGTESALSAQETRLAAPPTSPPPPTPRPTSTRLPTRTPGPTMYTDDFSMPSDLWPDCGVCEREMGELIMGPYPASSGRLSGYVALCGECGTVQDYAMGVDCRFVDGYTDRGYGLVLWYDEATGSYIDLEITTWQVYSVWSYDAKKNSWSSLSGGWLYGPALYASFGQNRVDVRVEGKTAEIHLNDVNVLVIENMPATPGRVGLTVAMHSMQVAFDNFILEIPVGADTSGGADS